MGFIKEFKDFAVKGNVIDLAVGVIIGAAFGKIVTSLVNDIIMPPIGLVTGGIDFTNLKFVLKQAVLDETGKVVSEAVSINYGSFINITIQFIIIAFCVFVIVKGFNSLKKKAEDPKNEEAPTPKDILLLTEIRDLLKGETSSKIDEDQNTANED
ncbi:large-conductance mechanosensitive channel protein MscL [Bernardetia sp.]|uniref:large-conductance mechanosensitive channel protein MscL n=1 Tax=Bernardetia sp. TaxID=1937974 RepID=UPI0025C5A349|nr:large-conductance mechanosensitive channel protein MscL [Bernardetia sp.]